MWAYNYGRGHTDRQTDRQTDAHTHIHTHTDARDHNTFTLSTTHTKCNEVPTIYWRGATRTHAVSKTSVKF